jgi:hypothetical protein
MTSRINIARCIKSRCSNVYINERKIRPMALEFSEEREGDKEGWARWKMKATAAKRKLIPESDKGEARHYFFSCPALDIWSVGATRKEAETRLREELLMLLMRCSRYDELDYFLMDSCFTTFEVRPS